MKTYIAFTSEIQGFRDVSETVKSVERIAAARIHILKRENAALDSYVHELSTRIARVRLFYPASGHPLLHRNRSGSKAVVLLSGDMGLVGGLWHGLINELLSHGAYETVIVVGNKAAMYLKEERIVLAKTFSQIPDALPGVHTDEVMKEITTYLFGEYIKGSFSQVDILYPRCLSLAHQEPSIVPFLPFDFDTASSRVQAKQKGTDAMGFPVFEPSKTVFFDHLLQKYIAISFHRIVAEMKLSELSARTVAMENASSKTDEMVHKLKLDFIKERHRLSTQKQLESFATHHSN